MSIVETKSLQLYSTPSMTSSAAVPGFTLAYSHPHQRGIYVRRQSSNTGGQVNKQPAAKNYCCFCSLGEFVFFFFSTTATATIVVLILLPYHHYCWEEELIASSSSVYMNILFLFFYYDRLAYNQPSRRCIVVEDDPFIHYKERGRRMANKVLNYIAAQSTHYSHRLRRRRRWRRALHRIRDRISEIELMAICELI